MTNLEMQEQVLADAIPNIDAFWEKLSSMKDAGMPHDEIFLDLIEHIEMLDVGVTNSIIAALKDVIAEVS